MEISGKNIAIISYITIIGWIVAIVLHSENKTRIGAFHLRQSLGLFSMAVACAILQFMFMWIPILGWLIAFSIWILMVAIIAFVILGIIMAANDQEKTLPIIGPFFQNVFKGLIPDPTDPTLPPWP